MLNFSKIPNNKNLTSLIMRTYESDSYEQTIKFINWLLEIAPEPRIFSDAHLRLTYNKK